MYPSRKTVRLQEVDDGKQHGISHVEVLLVELLTVDGGPEETTVEVRDILKQIDGLYLCRALVRLVVHHVVEERLAELLVERPGVEPVFVGVFERPEQAGLNEGLVFEELDEDESVHQFDREEPGVVLGGFIWSDDAVTDERAGGLLVVADDAEDVLNVIVVELIRDLRFLLFDDLPGVPGD